MYIRIVQSSKSRVVNNSVKTNKLFKFRIFRYYRVRAQCK